MHTILVMSANGVGLAANQIGVLKRAIVIRPSVHHKFTQRMLNPEIVNTDGPMIRDIEGCLSYPGYDVEVSRASGIEISYYDIDWEPQQYWVHGYEARIIQHEIDHLNGICKVGEEWRRIIQEGT